jgi:hypothetical protein
LTDDGAARFGDVIADLVARVDRRTDLGDVVCDDQVQNRNVDEVQYP